MTGNFSTQLINMGTRAAAFQAKLRCLHDYHLRLLYNVIPSPSGIDIANTIKYFSQTFLSVLKDVPSSPHQMIKDPSQDHVRMSAYPNLEYGNLYNALAMLLDVAPNIQNGLQNFGKAVLQCLGCILPFLDKDLIDNIPYLTASSIASLPPLLHQDIINSLCFYILPFTITRSLYDEHECQSCQSIAAVIMLVFQYSNNPAHHCQLLECLMTLKQNVVKDLLCVIAYGTSTSRSSAAKLLFYYWPAFNAELFDRRGLLCKFNNDLVPFVCQRETCPNAGNAEAAKVCFDHNISITYAPDCPPPLYLCIECANEIHREHPDLTFGDILHPMAQVSMICENKNCRSTEKSAVSICFSNECASYNGNHPIRYCIQCHGNRHNSRRGGDHIVHRSLSVAWHMELEMQTYMIEAVVSLLREAKPLNFEAEKCESSEIKNHSDIQDNMPLEERQLLGKYGIWLLVGRCTPTESTPKEILGRLLSMLFHWFHVTASYEYDGQIESAVEKLKIDHVCGWLKNISKTHYKVFKECLIPLPPEYSKVGGHWDILGSKTSHLKEGLQRLICLIPYDVITPKLWYNIMPLWMEAITNDVPEKDLKELKIVLSKILDPEMSPLGFDAKGMYSFVSTKFVRKSARIQEKAILWLQILSKLEILIPLSQLFAMFGNGVRFMKQSVHQLDHHNTDNNTNGIQIEIKKNPLKTSPITVPAEDDIDYEVLYNDSDLYDDTDKKETVDDSINNPEYNLTCCILMLDVLLKQMQLQDVEQHLGINTQVCENVCRLLKCMVAAVKIGQISHVCSLKVTECVYCESLVMWHQLSTQLVLFMAPEEPIRGPDPPLDEMLDDERLARKSPPESDKGKERDVCLSMAPLPIPLGPLGFGDIWRVPPIFDDPGKLIIMAGPVPVAVPQPDPHSVGGVLVHMPHVCSISERGRETDIARFIHATDEIMTATVETVSEQLDLAAIMPSEKVVTAIARSITLSDADVATATVHVAKPQLVGSNSTNDQDKNGTLLEDVVDDTEDGNDFWVTSVGKFKFSLDSLPQSLQYIHQLLTELPTTEKPDILYYILQCLNILTLHGDALSKASKDHRGFFIWCQENLLIKNLWDLCNAEHSNIAQVCVPILLHCITLPLGSDVFWRIVQEAFNDSDWRIRFTAVERVTVITRFMDSTPLRAEVGLQTSLATAFCHLICSMDDINVHVAQRATLYLGTIHDKAITSLLCCLECQFDLFIVDRPVVLQSIYQLHNSLSDRKVLAWEFFLNRFDTLFVEAQINLEKSGDLLYLRDLRNSETGSELLSSKINKAREALSQSDTTCSMAKTLSASFGTKWPYKRTMSAPASIIPRQDSKIEKEKTYNRQISAPILKRKTSRFGLAQQYQHQQQQQQQQQQIQQHPYSCMGTSDGLHMGPIEDSNLANCLHRIIDLEEADKETTHLLVFLLMQFLSRADQAYPSEEKYMIKIQTIVLRHLYLLLGFNQQDKTFHIPANKLKSSAILNVFIANLPQLLDQNHLMGWSMLPSILQILLYVPSQININNPNGTESLHSILYTYSLWYLESHVRKNWLMSVVVILYKYNYTQLPYSVNINNLIRIILNSLEAHFHRCKRIPTTIVLDFQASTRSRDVSQPSLGCGTEQNDRVDGETPPASPLFASEGTSYGAGTCSKSKPQQKSGPTFRKFQDSSIDADDTESELVAIPESDLSDSTLHGGSAPGSFDDPLHFEEVVLPLKPDIFKNKSATAHGMTASNLAHFAMTTLGVSEQRTEEKSETKKTQKTQKTITSSSITKTNNGKTIQKTVSTTETSSTTNNRSFLSKCSVQEGVRMMVTPSMFMTERAMLNPPVNVQRAVVISQSNGGTTIGSSSSAPQTSNITSTNTKPTTASSSSSTTRVSELSTTKMIATMTSNQLKTFGMIPGNNGDSQKIDVNSSEKHKKDEATTNNNHNKTVITKKTEETTIISTKHSKTVENGSTTTAASKSGANNNNNNNNNWLEQRALSPIPKTLGRQKRIIEPPSTPASTPITQTAVQSPSDDLRNNNRSSLTYVGGSTNGNSTGIKQRTQFRSFDRTSDYGSPESPLSKMTVMPNPISQDNIDDDEMLSPKSISQLEFPMPERLLPIGQYGKEGICALVEKVREALAVPDISYVRQDSLDKSESIGSGKEDLTSNSRCTSPRRLIKQVALESPPNVTNDDLHSTMVRAVTEKLVDKPKEESYRSQRQRLRKIGPFAVDSQSVPDSRTKYAGSWSPLEQHNSEDGEEFNQNKANEQKESSKRVGEDCVCHRCIECGTMLEEYNDEEIGLMVVNLGTFIHREPTLAAQCLPEILEIVSRFATHFTFPWQYAKSTHLPGGSQSVAHQFIRCVLHQLAPNGVFYQIFLNQSAEIQRKKYFKSIAKALVDFNELNPTSPVHLLVETINSKKTLPLDTLPVVLRNMGDYLQVVPMDAGISASIWSPVIQGIEALFRRLVLVLHNFHDTAFLLDIMISVLRIPSVSKGVLDPFCKVLSFVIQNSTLKYKVLNDLCTLSSRAFSKDRDKQQLCRQLVFELIQALKFKTNIPDANLLLLVGFILQDTGGALPNGIIDGLPDTIISYTINSAECMRQYMNDILEFLADFHTLSKIKNFKNGSVIVGLGEDTLGGVLKGAIAQYLALEMSRGNSRDNKSVSRYLPWLNNAPSSLQQGPKEFTECIGHMRLLSWLLIGALTHTVLMTQKGGNIGQHGASVQYQLQHPSPSFAQPVPQESSCHIADHIQVIFAGFTELSKTSVLHMSSLFHAFTLCQLWTVYLEQLACISLPSTEPYNITMGVLFEFWSKVTPCILQLVSSSKVLSEMVNLHFLSLLEALKETRSTIIAKLLPLWTPVLSSHSPLSGTLHVRLQNCRDFPPSYTDDVHQSDGLLKWLQRLQFKMGQIELQSSTATQFYSI